jgi:hypothetical protein
MRWRLLGLVPVMAADGPDLSRSAAGRVVGEAMWVPTALLPRFGVSWSATDDHHLTARWRIDSHEAALELALDDQGRAGWFYGTDRWPEGEFFRYQLTSMELLTR